MRQISSLTSVLFILSISTLLSLAFGTCSSDLPECSGTVNLHYEYATLGGGCFWCTEAIFQLIPGVINVESGYSGGHIPNPAYQEVKKGKTGHAEVIRIIFNPNIVSYEELLNSFFYAHDPTLLNRQGVDVGHQYRSVIYYHNEGQKKIAEKVIQLFELKGIYSDPIVTELAPLINYYPAEDYHQDYFETYKQNPYITIDTVDIIQKVDKFFTKFNDTVLLTKEKEEKHRELLAQRKSAYPNIKVVKSSNPFNPWHYISLGTEAPEKVQAFIEISMGSIIKNEIDKISGYLSVDRVLNKDFPYPINYGFIPQTLYGDGDALDILIFCDEPILPNTLVKVRIVGMLNMIDNDELDDKILAVVNSDPSFMNVEDLEDLDSSVIQKLKTFFETYKKDENRVVEVKKVAGKEEAFKAIKESIQLYRDFYVFDN